MSTVLWSIVSVLAYPFFRIWIALRPTPTVTKVLIIQLGKLGDVLCTTPMIRAIKQAHPAWQVHVLCLGKSSEALKNNPMVAGVHLMDVQGRRQLLSLLRREGFTWVINCMPGAFSSVIGLWALAPLRVNTVSNAHGILVRVLAICNGWNRTFRIRTSVFAHYLSLLEPLGVPAIARTIDFFPSSQDAAEVERWLSERGLSSKAFFCINLTAGNGVKEWPADRFAALADRIIETYGLPVVFSTLDLAVQERTKELMKHAASAHAAAGFTLGQSGELYRHAKAFVSVDTGPLYVAYAMRTPLVVILGPVHSAEQVPQESAIVAHVPPPAGCEPWVFVSLTPRTGTPDQLRCVRETSVDAVFAALQKVV